MIILIIGASHTGKTLLAQKNSCPYHRICEYMQFRDVGVVLGRGCGAPEMKKSSGYIKRLTSWERRSEMIGMEDFDKVETRAGTVIDVKDNRTRKEHLYS